MDYLRELVQRLSESMQARIDKLLDTCAVTMDHPFAGYPWSAKQGEDPLDMLFKARPVVGLLPAMCESLQAARPKRKPPEVLAIPYEDYHDKMDYLLAHNRFLAQSINRLASQYFQSSNG
jgi:hypothetical protein